MWTIGVVGKFKTLSIKNEGSVSNQMTTKRIKQDKVINEAYDRNGRTQANNCQLSVYREDQ